MFLRRAFTLFLCYLVSIAPCYSMFSIQPKKITNDSGHQEYAVVDEGVIDRYTNLRSSQDNYQNAIAAIRMMLIRDSLQTLSEVKNDFGPHILNDESLLAARHEDGTFSNDKLFEIMRNNPMYKVPQSVKDMYVIKTKKMSTDSSDNNYQFVSGVSAVHQLVEKIENPMPEEVPSVVNFVPYFEFYADLSIQLAFIDHQMHVFLEQMWLTDRYLDALKEAYKVEPKKTVTSAKYGYSTITPSFDQFAPIFKNRIMEAYGLKHHLAYLQAMKDQILLQHPHLKAVVDYYNKTGLKHGGKYFYQYMYHMLMDYLGPDYDANGSILSYSGLPPVHYYQPSPKKLTKETFEANKNKTFIYDQKMLAPFTFDKINKDIIELTPSIDDVAKNEFNLKEDECQQDCMKVLKLDFMDDETETKSDFLSNLYTKKEIASRRFENFSQNFQALSLYGVKGASAKDNQQIRVIPTSIYELLYYSKIPKWEQVDTFKWWTLGKSGQPTSKEYSVMASFFTKFRAIVAGRVEANLNFIEALTQTPVLNPRSKDPEPAEYLMSELLRDFEIYGDKVVLIQNQVWDRAAEYFEAYKRPNGSQFIDWEAARNVHRDFMVNKDKVNEKIDKLKNRSIIALLIAGAATSSIATKYSSLMAKNVAKWLGIRSIAQKNLPYFGQAATRQLGKLSEVLITVGSFVYSFGAVKDYIDAKKYTQMTAMINLGLPGYHGDTNKIIEAQDSERRAWQNAYWSLLLTATPMRVFRVFKGIVKSNSFQFVKSKLLDSLKPLVTFFGKRLSSVRLLKNLITKMNNFSSTRKFVHNINEAVRRDRRSFLESAWRAGDESVDYHRSLYMKETKQMVKDVSQLAASADTAGMSAAAKQAINTEIWDRVQKFVGRYVVSEANKTRVVQSIDDLLFVNKSSREIMSSATNRFLINQISKIKMMGVAVLTEATIESTLSVSSDVALRGWESAFKEEWLFTLSNMIGSMAIVGYNALLSTEIPPQYRLWNYQGKFQWKNWWYQGKKLGVMTFAAVGVTVALTELAYQLQQDSQWKKPNDFHIVDRMARTAITSLSYMLFLSLTSTPRTNFMYDFLSNQRNINPQFSGLFGSSKKTISNAFNKLQQVFPNYSAHDIQIGASFINNALGSYASTYLLANMLRIQKPPFFETGEELFNFQKRVLEKWQEVLENPSHPQHSEAIVVNKALNETFGSYDEGFYLLDQMPNGSYVFGVDQVGATYIDSNDLLTVNE